MAGGLRAGHRMDVLYLSRRRNNRVGGGGGEWLNTVVRRGGRDLYGKHVTCHAASLPNGARPTVGLIRFISCAVCAVVLCCRLFPFPPTADLLQAVPLPCLRPGVHDLNGRIGVGLGMGLGAGLDAGQGCRGHVHGRGRRKGPWAGGRGGAERRPRSRGAKEGGTARARGAVAYHEAVWARTGEVTSALVLKCIDSMPYRMPAGRQLAPSSHHAGEVTVSCAALCSAVVRCWLCVQVFIFLTGAVR